MRSHSGAKLLLAGKESRPRGKLAISPPPFAIITCGQPCAIIGVDESIPPH